MTKEAENNVDNSEEILSSLDDSIEIIADEKGREIRKSADHPDKTRDIIFLDEDEENQENENSNNTSVLLVQKKRRRRNWIDVYQKLWRRRGERRLKTEKRRINLLCKYTLSSKK